MRRHRYKKDDEPDSLKVAVTWTKKNYVAIKAYADRNNMSFSWAANIFVEGTMNNE